MSGEIMKNPSTFVDYEEKERKILRELAVTYGIKDFDEESCLELSNVRRPLYLIRGKSITVEQVMKLVTGEDPLFGEGPKDGFIGDPRACAGVILGNLFRRAGELSTWVYSDGTIGGDFVSALKYPELPWFLPKYMHLAEAYPFLDFVISYTFHDEACCFGCDYLRTGSMDGVDGNCMDCQFCLDHIKYYKDNWDTASNFEEWYYSRWERHHVRSDIGEFVCLTIWIHNGKTEVLFGDKAIAKFNEYNTLYCDPEYAFMFSPYLYNVKNICIYNQKFVEDCFEYIGKPRSLCDEYVKRRLIPPFHEKAIVLTKAWVTEQYHTFIAKK